MIIITAKKDGFRRCGVAHSAKPVEHLDDAFTPEQLAELQADPMLVVEIAANAAGIIGSKPASKPAGKKTDKE
jgi:hypothetical protein